MTEPVNTDSLPPTEYLILEVLAARTRLGEHAWTFPARLNKALESLARRGLVSWKAASIERHSLAWLTALGRESALSATYTPPAGDGHMTIEIDVKLPAEIPGLVRLSREIEQAVRRSGLTCSPATVRGEQA